MRIYGPSSPRNNALDRNPTTLHFGALSTQGGGTNVVVATYTVPANRRARIESTWNWFLITTALAAGQSISSHIQVTVPAPTTPVVVTDSGPAAIGPESEGDSVGPVELSAGETIEARAIVGIGAGVVSFRLGFHGVEYDA